MTLRERQPHRGVAKPGSLARAEKAKGYMLRTHRKEHKAKEIDTPRRGRHLKKEEVRKKDVFHLT